MSEKLDVMFDAISVRVVDAGQGWARLEGSIDLEGKELIVLLPETVRKGDAYTVTFGCVAVAPMMKVT